MSGSFIWDIELSRNHFLWPTELLFLQSEGRRRPERKEYVDKHGHGCVGKRGTGLTFCGEKGETEVLEMRSVERVGQKTGEGVKGW